MNNWYVFFVKAGRERIVDYLFRAKMDSCIFSPFIPMLETMFISSGRVKKEVNPLFPGYLFVESILADTEFTVETREFVKNNPNIIRLLKYGDSDKTALKESEQLNLMKLFNDDNCIKGSKGFILGDRVYVKEGPLVGKESIIKRINRHKRQAVLEMCVMGGIREVIVCLEILERV